MQRVQGRLRADPDTVRKLNLDPGKVTNLFMPRKEPMRDQKGNPILCDFCKELRYKGRFGVFEILDVDKDVKQIVSGGGSVNQLKAVFRKQRGRFSQEVALRRLPRVRRRCRRWCGCCGRMKARLRRRRRLAVVLARRAQGGRGPRRVAAPAASPRAPSRVA